jgi:tRNA-dihydrouridine synthase
MERDTDLVCRILSQLRKDLPASVAVSAKVRLPFDDSTLGDRIPRLIDTGVNFLTIHGRTLEENKTKVRACHLDRIRLAAEIAHQHKPGFTIIANGGVESFSDVSRVQKETGAVAVMSSEALLECPNLFVKDSSTLSRRQLLEQQFSFAREYLLWCRAYPPLPGVLGHDGGSFNVARGHLFKFLHRYLQEHADLRDRLASNQIRTVRQATELIEALHQRYQGMTDDDLSRCKSSHLNSSWYRRHWDATENVHIHQRHRNSLHASGSPVIGDILSLEQRKQAIRQRIAQLRKRKDKVTAAMTE